MIDTSVLGSGLAGVSTDISGLVNMSSLGSGLASIGGVTTAVSTINPSGTTTFTQGSQLAPSVIPQTERLFTTRSRGINFLSQGGDRGQHTYIRIMTPNASDSLAKHIADAGGQAQSLGTTSSGPLSDAFNSNATYGGYASFILTDIQGSFDEKIQVSETFGDAEVVYYFGRQPIIMNFSGVLIDSVDNNWFVQWIDMYGQVMRGSQLARNYELVQIVTPNMTIIGTITRMSWNQSSSTDTAIPFQFSFLAKEIIPTPVIGIGQPLSDTSVIDFSQAASFMTQSDITAHKTQSTDILNVVQNPFSTVQDYSSVLSNTFSSSSTPFSIGGSGNVSSTLTGSGTQIPGVTNNSIFATVSSNLAGIRASLFSPVYGVLSSLTKLIKGSTGSVSSVINSFVSPVMNILRDINSISNQAIGVVNLINNSISSITNIENSLDVQLRSTLALLNKTAGVISTAPQSITSHLRDLVNAGRLPATTGFLQNKVGTLISGGNGASNKLAMLNSGSPHTAESGAHL